MKMPIKITDVDWSQRESSLSIKLGLKNCNSKNIDIVCTSSYIKVNFNPYIYEAFLRHKIEPENSSSIIKEGVLHFHLTKALNEEWESLDTSPKSKEEAQSLRAVALKEYEELEKKLCKGKKESKVSLEQLAIAKQISLNEENRVRHREVIKQEEKKFFSDSEGISADSSSKADRLRLSSLCSEDGSLATSEGDYDGDEESINFSSTENLPGMLKSNQESTVKNAKEDTKTILPNIRQTCVIKIQHSFHKPSVPKRESLTDEDFKNTNETENGDDDANAKEREALKCEATKCFTCGDFEGAVKCYTKLIDLFPNQASYYSNRAATLLALNSSLSAVKDCSKALELLSSPTPENAKSRLLCHVRRGTAYVRIKDLASGLRDFEAAFRLDPNNVSLAKDAAVIRASLNAYTDTGDDTEDSLSESNAESEDRSDSEKKLDDGNREQSQSESYSS